MKSFWKRMVPNIKFGLVILGTQLVMSIFSIVLGGLGEETHIALRIVLGVLFLVGVVVMIYAYTRNVAYNEFNRRQNNRTRERNGEPVDDNMRGREYVWYKGYVVGAFCALPLIVTTTVLCFGENAAASLISFGLYGCFIFPIYLAIAPVTHAAFQFIAVAIVILMPGVTYHLQGIKLQKGLARKIDSRVKR